MILTSKYEKTNISSIMENQQRVCKPNVSYEMLLQANDRGYFVDRGEISCEGCPLKLEHPKVPLAIELGSPLTNFDMRQVLMHWEGRCEIFRRELFPELYKAFQDPVPQRAVSEFTEFLLDLPRKDPRFIRAMKAQEKGRKNPARTSGRTKWR